MNKFIFLVSTILCFLNASAIDFKSFKKLNPESEIANSLLKSLHTFDNSERISSRPNDLLIHQNLNKDWKKPLDIFDIKTTKPVQRFDYIEGTGTRGGGSGILVQVSADFTEVKLLEIFRSENLTQYNLFFPIDAELRSLENGKDADKAAQIIFETVLDRISKVAPKLSSRIKSLYQVELPFEKWIPLISDLPNIEDELKYPFDMKQERIQIAYRRTHYVMYNQRAYAAMSPLNRAALWMHEYLYALSGLENSIKTQRAVSLFFSSEFLKVARDELTLTQLFFDLDLLGLSRKSIGSSLPPGAQLASRKQSNNCGIMTGIKAASTSSPIELSIQLEENLVSLILNRSEAKIVLNSIMWSKNFLEKDFPLYKTPGHKILPDKICLNSTLQKVTQTQSALALDEKVQMAAFKAAQAEVEYFKAVSQLTSLIDNSTGHNSDRSESLLQESIANVRMKIEAQATEDVHLQSVTRTSLERLLNPNILGEYNIQIDY